MGYIDTMTVSLNFIIGGTPSSAEEEFYVWVAPDPGKMFYNPIYHIDSPSRTNNKSSPAGIWSFATMEDKAYFMNGLGTYDTLTTAQYWTCEKNTPANTSTTIGGDGPDFSGGAVSATTTSAGDVRGVVRYKVSHVISSTETPLSEDYVEAELSGITNTVTLSGIPSVATAGDSTRLYRTYADRLQYYFLDYPT
jgi:hypothetical protein